MVIVFTRNAQSEDVATLRLLASPVNGATNGLRGKFMGIQWDLWDLVRFNRLPEGMFYEKEIVWDLMKFDHHPKFSN